MSLKQMPHQCNLWHHKAFDMNDLQTA